MTHPTDDQLREALTRDLNALRAAASRGPVSSREVFQMTDPMMDRLSRAALAVAPQPAPAPADERAKRLQDAMVQDILETPIEEIEAEVREREAADERAAMIEDIAYATQEWAIPVGLNPAGKLADALLAAGWTRGGAEAGLREALAELVAACQTTDIKRADAALDKGIATLARPSAPETLAWAVIGETKPFPIIAWPSRAKAVQSRLVGERVQRVAIRVVEGEA